MQVQIEQQLLFVLPVCCSQASLNLGAHADIKKYETGPMLCLTCPVAAVKSVEC